MLFGGDGMNDLFRKCLKKGSDYVHADQKAMFEWVKGQIGTTVLFLRICNNNKIPDEISEKVNMDEFVNWIHGMGWYQDDQY